MMPPIAKLSDRIPDGYRLAIRICEMDELLICEKALASTSTVAMRYWGSDTANPAEILQRWITCPFE
jgi:hypothetical protein